MFAVHEQVLTLDSYNSFTIWSPSSRPCQLMHSGYTDGPFASIAHTYVCKRLQRSPSYPDLLHHARQIPGSAFGSSLLLYQLGTSNLFTSQEDQTQGCVCSHAYVCSDVFEQSILTSNHYQLVLCHSPTPQLSTPALSISSIFPPLAIITGSIHHLKRDAIYTISAMSLFLEETIFPNMVSHMCLQLAAHVRRAPFKCT